LGTRLVTRTADDILTETVEDEAIVAVADRVVVG
jgi:hypothetical protein